MAIKVGDKLPDATFMTMGADGPKPMTTAEAFGGTVPLDDVSLTVHGGELGQDDLAQPRRGSATSRLGHRPALRARPA